MRPYFLAIALLAGCRSAVPSAPPRLVPKLSPSQSARRLGLRIPFDRVFLRGFKREGELELWAANARGPLRLVKTYPIAAMSGTLGPKRREGDLQVPEGVYVIDRFNPTSHYHLSMRIDYPNASDRRRGDSRRPGTDIYIHGKAVSAGCLAMTDPLIDEIYPACERAGNRRTIQVHLFPARLTNSNLNLLASRVPAQAAFWRELEPIYDAFERTHVVPRVRIDRSGAYRLVR